MTTTTTTKKQRREEQLNKHYATLEALAIKCGVTNPNGKKLSVALLKAERIVSKAATDYCNGDIEQDNWEAISDKEVNSIQKLFNNNLIGLFANGDPRGYALKINDKALNTHYKEIPMHKDWGGYGILSPEITGN